YLKYSHKSNHGGKNAIKGRQRTRICMKYHLKAFITVGVLGGDGQSAAVVNDPERLESHYAPDSSVRSLGTSRSKNGGRASIHQRARPQKNTRPQAEGRGEPSARPSPEHASSVPRWVAPAGVDVSHGNGERVSTPP
ncbi:hypothetical protein E2I00_019917, partial [Balaenoptera physalus]